jgi:hypothetical protein
MPSIGQQSIPKDKFLMLSINLLHRQFIALGRTEAKRLYREIQEGRTAPLSTVKMEDNSTVRFQLTLDGSEYPGKLNFSAFRASLSLLLGNVSRALQEGRDVAVFSMKERPESVLFGITAVTVEDSQPSVMALGADLENKAGAIILRLMYLDPAQFARAQTATAAAEAGTA